MVKRIFDIVVASVLIVLLAPFMVAIAVLVKFSSPGQVFFVQRRMGQHKKWFWIYKFRTMRAGSGTKGGLVQNGDPRVTRVGKLLRQTHLDELPQLINVLYGDMSLVGPRPVPVDVARERLKRIKGYERVFLIRPGLTGLGQIQGRTKCTRSNFRGVVLLNDYYMRHQGICFDARILLRTVAVVLRRQGV